MTTKFDISKINIKTKRLIIRECTKNELFSLYENEPVSKLQLNYSIQYNNVLAIFYSGTVIGEITLAASPLCRFSEYSHLFIREISYFIKENYRNQGFATEGLRAVCEYLFSHFPLDALSATHLEKNEASKKVLIKSGFEFIFKENDKLYYILKAKSVP